MEEEPLFSTSTGKEVMDIHLKEKTGISRSSIDSSVAAGGCWTG
jgi:hypothetical protein